MFTSHVFTNNTNAPSKNKNRVTDFDIAQSATRLSLLTNTGLVALRHYRDLTIEDIAQVLDVPVSTANSRLRTARARLRDVLDGSVPAGAER